MNKKLNIVFESPTKWHKWLMKFYLWRGFKVWIIEPFHAYHRQVKGKSRFFPAALPTYMWDLIKAGRIALIKAETLDARHIYPIAADRAVSTVEQVFPEYKKLNTPIINYICETLKSPLAENIFRKEICDQLGRFYSINIMFEKIEQFFPKEQIVLYPEINIIDYLYYKKIIIQARQPVFEHPGITFPYLIFFFGFLRNTKENLVAFARLGLQTVVSGLFYYLREKAKKSKKKYKFAVAVISDRQLRNNRRRADFLVDNNLLRAEEVVYFPILQLKDAHKTELLKLKGTVFYPPSIKRNFSNFWSWFKLLKLALSVSFLNTQITLKTACLALAEYFRWKIVLQSININNFVTHCDFGSGHIARNIALKQSGVQTWYFTDSMNSIVNFKDENKDCDMRHPFISYLYYDYFVTWDDFISHYFSQHHTFLERICVVGCLWAGYIAKKKTAFDKFTIAVFDTTYSCNSLTSYQEGIVFAQHLLELVNEFPWIILLMKEKKSSDRKYHATLDPIASPGLLALYEKMYQHERIKQYTNQGDTAEIISKADMVISFPYTSTTFEALSVNKPALWHDPLGFYRDTPYGKIGGVTTHSYEELKAKIIEIMRMKPGTYQSPIPKDSPLMDPYCDGKAIERFRQLLAA